MLVQNKNVTLYLRR